MTKELWIDLKYAAIIKAGFIAPKLNILCLPDKEVLMVMGENVYFSVFWENLHCESRCL